MNKDGQFVVSLREHLEKVIDLRFESIETQIKEARRLMEKTMDGFPEQFLKVGAFEPVKTEIKAVVKLLDQMEGKATGLLYYAAIDKGLILEKGVTNPGEVTGSGVELIAHQDIKLLCDQLTVKGVVEEIIDKGEIYWNKLATSEDTSDLEYAVGVIGVG